jgi:uncharacterized protein YndB with AHSA1/START domain
MAERVRQFWKVVIAAPIETVWNTIVQTDEVLPFLFGAICDTENGLKPGRPMRMLTKDGKSVVAYGEVLEFSPPHRFSHAINFTMADNEPPGTTTYELKEVPGGTELTLISEAPAGSQTAKMARSGQFIVDNLKAWIERQSLTLGGRMMLMSSPLVSMFTPARCGAEKWPLSRVPLRVDKSAPSGGA